jgi:hypothetical protein
MRIKTNFLCRVIKLRDWKPSRGNISYWICPTALNHLTKAERTVLKSAETSGHWTGRFECFFKSSRRTLRNEKLGHLVLPMRCSQHCTPTSTSTDFQLNHAGWLSESYHFALLSFSSPLLRFVGCREKKLKFMPFTRLIKSERRRRQAQQSQNKQKDFNFK